MLKWYVEYQLASDAYALRLVDRQEGGTKAVATNVVMENIEPGSYVAPFMTMGADEMQTLFNSMWSEGFRPKDGTGNSGHIEAMKYHLEDMRKLVFKDTK